MNTTTSETQEETVIVRTISYDGIMGDEDVEAVTDLSRVTRWRMERKGKFPRRVQISPGRVGWMGEEVKEWVESRPRVNIAPCEIGSREGSS